jgi:signal peptidase I
MSESPQDAPIPPVDSSVQGAALVPRRSRWLREIVDTLLLTAFIFLVVNAATGRFLIRSVSMQPNLVEDERVIVDKVSYLFHPPQRGDIVVIDRPDEQEDLIKRVIGLPGETIEISAGVVYIDGRPLNEPYARLSTGDSPSRRLGADEYFIMGDNRANSKDSRLFGPIPRDSIVGRAWIIYWPPANWGLVPRPVYADDSSPQ